MYRMMIAAPKSGSGKTALVCGLLRLFQQEGLKTAAFKCGPDYIDPMFHSRVLGTDSCNLDSFFLEPEKLQNLFWRKAAQAEAVVAEGVMGYFDGIGISGRASSWDVARILKLPVILAVDGRGAGLSLVAEIKGFLEYRPADFSGELKPIAGVILNRTSPAMGQMLKEPIEKELGIPFLGAVPPLPWLDLKSRHLGLLLPDEIPGLEEQTRRLAMVLKENLDLERLFAVTEAGEPDFAGCSPEKGREDFCLAVARDEAFSFYYRENLELLEEQGARILPFSPLRDSEIPPGAQGVLLGGGYPEVYAKELSANESMRESIRRKALCGMPMAAECGGYLYLLKELEGTDGRFYPMVGLWEGEGVREEKLRHFGYVTVRAGQDSPYLKAGEEIRGHEFHYWQCRLDEELGVMEAVKPSGGRSWPAMRIRNQVMAGFPHLYYPSLPEFAWRFGEACRRYGRLEHEKKEE